MEKGTYKLKGNAQAIFIKSNCYIEANGAVLDFSECTNTSIGRLRTQDPKIIFESSLVLDLVAGSTTLDVQDGSGFNVGDIVSVLSSEQFSSDCAKGELLKISKIFGNTIYTDDTVSINYNASTTKIVKSINAENIIINGLSMKGRGTIDSANGIDERAIMLNSVVNFHLKGLNIYGFDRMGISFIDCYNGVLSNSEIMASARFNEDFKYIQYCVSIADKCKNIKVQNNQLNGGRHGVAFTVYSKTGLSINCFIINNTICRSYAAGIATHKSNLKYKMLGNTITSCGNGFDIRSPEGLISNNQIFNCQDSMVWLRGWLKMSLLVIMSSVEEILESEPLHLK